MDEQYGKIKENFISVIVPVYNSESYLEECLTSICKQTYPNLEIIVVNDGSTDQSEKIIRKYSQNDARVRLINQENQGISSARNVGLQYATGDYVMFVDSDDWIDAETCATAIQRICDTDADVVLWSYIKEYKNSSNPVYLFGENDFEWNESEVQSLYRQFIGLRGKQLQEPQKIDSIVTVWGKLYQKNIIRDLKFVDTNIIGTEDALFNIQAFSKVTKAVYISIPFSHYRKTNTESFTRNYKNQLVFQWQELYRRINQHLKENGAEKEDYQALNNRIALGLIGLGLNIAEDNRMSFKEKQCELRKILRMSHYRTVLKSLPLNDLPIHWKVFFICAKYEWSFLLSVLLLIMNRMRG